MAKVLNEIYRLFKIFLKRINKIKIYHFLNVCLLVFFFGVFVTFLVICMIFMRGSVFFMVVPTITIKQNDFTLFKKLFYYKRNDLTECSLK